MRLILCKHDAAWIDVEYLRERLGSSEEIGELLCEDDEIQVYLVVRKKPRNDWARGERG